MTPAYDGSPTEFGERLNAVLTDVKALLALPANSVGFIDILADPSAVRPNSFVIKAHDEGLWGNDIVIQAAHETGARAELDTSVGNGMAAPGALNDNQLVLKSTAGFYKNAWVEIDRGQEKRYRKVLKVAGSVITLDGARLDTGAVANSISPQAPATTTILSVCEFKLVVTYGDVVEQFIRLTLENVPDKYFVDVINNASSLIQIVAPALGTPTHPFLFPSGDDGLNITLANGIDVTAPPGDNDYKGVDNGPGKRTGIRALEDIDQVSIIAAPGLV